MMAVEKMQSLRACPATVFTASATEEVGQSKIASTPWLSYQARARLEPMSGLFW